MSEISTSVPKVQLPADYAPLQQAPWRQPRTRRSSTVWESVTIALGSLMLFTFVFLTMLGVGPTAVLVAGFLALIPLGMILFIISWADRWEPEPWVLVCTAILWGAGVSVLTASFLNQPVGVAVASALGQTGLSDDTAAAVYGAPLVEEGLKGLGVLLIFLIRRRYFSGPLDGIIYAGLVAAGFAFAENIQYFSSAPPEALPVTFVLRAVLSPFGHIVFTSCTGLALGLSTRTRNSWSWVLLLPIGYAGAVTLHHLWNSGASAQETLGQFFTHLLLVNWLPLAILGVIVAFLRHQEGTQVALRLQDYVHAGWLSDSEVKMLSSLSGRSQAMKWARSGGSTSADAMQDFQRSATALALARENLVQNRQTELAAEDQDYFLNRITQDRHLIRGSLR